MSGPRPRLQPGVRASFTQPEFARHVLYWGHRMTCPYRNVFLGFDMYGIYLNYDRQHYPDEICALGPIDWDYAEGRLLCAGEPSPALRRAADLADLFRDPLTCLAIACGQPPLLARFCR